MFHIGASFVSLAPIFYKSQSALILLLLLSKSQPLALGCDLVCRLTDGFDRPASFSSTHDRWTLHEHLLFQRRLCRQGVAVMSKQKLRVKVLMCLDPRFFIFCTLVRPFIKPLRISNMMSCSQDTLSDFPISCNLAGNRVLAHGTMHLVHCFKKHDSIK